MAFCDSAGLIKYYAVDLAGAFKALGIFDKDTVLGAFSYSNHYCCRCGQPQRARAGYYQHCYHSH